MATIRRILVLFHGDGDGEGVGELTWGQQVIWDAMRQTGQTMNIGGTVPVEPGTTLKDVSMLLGFLVSRHQALRTRLLVPAAE